MHIPDKKLAELTDKPETLSLSSYIELIKATVKDLKMKSEFEIAVAGLL